MDFELGIGQPLPLLVQYCDPKQSVLHCRGSALHGCWWQQRPGVKGRAGKETEAAAAAGSPAAMASVAATRFSMIC